MPSISDSEVIIIKPEIDFKAAALPYLNKAKSNPLSFTTFSGKAKVQFEDVNGRQPDANALIRMKKDSLIWISVSATVLNIEALRILITNDTLIAINRLEKTIAYHPFSYIREVTQLPLTFSSLQDVILGNAILVGDTIISVHEKGNSINIETQNNLLKNLLSFDKSTQQLRESNLTDISSSPPRNAVIEYADYITNGVQLVPSYRSIKVPDQSKIDLRMSFKEMEFNKELSFPFSIPSNFQTK